MKRVLSWCCVLLISVSTALGQDSEPFEFSGVVAQSPDTPFRVMLEYDPDNQLQSGLVGEGITSGDGVFEIAFFVSDDQAFVFLIGRSLYRLWCEPGGDLTLTVLESGEVTLQGSVESENRFLLDHGLARPIGGKQVDNFDPRRHIETIDEQKASQLLALDLLLDDRSSSERFGLYARAEILGGAIYQKNMKPRMLMSQGLLAEEDLPVGYFDFLKSVPILDDLAALLSRRYQGSLQARFQFIAEQALLDGGIDPASDLGRWTREELEIQGVSLGDRSRTNELLYASKLDFMIQYLPALDTRQALDGFARRFPGSSHLEPLRIRFDDSLDIDLGMIDGEVEFRDASGDRVEFSSLEGVVVYVDFWGLWCVACMAQRPDLERLVDEFGEEEGLVFLGVNFFDSPESWEEFVLKHPGTEVHWKAASTEDEERARELFLLTSFPRYMIFGRDGKLISGSAPVPGSEEIRRMIREALDDE